MGRSGNIEDSNIDSSALSFEHVESDITTTPVLAPELYLGQSESAMRGTGQSTSHVPGDLTMGSPGDTDIAGAIGAQQSPVTVNITGSADQDSDSLT